MNGLFDRLRTRPAAFIHDLCMVPLSWFGAYWLRFNLETIPEVFLRRALWVLPLLLLVHGVMFWFFGLYRGVWRFASMPDFIRILKAVLAAMAVSAVLIYFQTGMLGVPRSAFILHSLLLLILLGSPRFFYRWIKDHKLYYRPGARVLIVGAGQAGEMLARDLLREAGGDYRPVAFVDDDPRKHGAELRGVRVLGNCEQIPQLVERQRIDQIFIALPNAPARDMRRVVTACEASGKPFRTLPRWQDLLIGQAVSRELRAVSIEDLLGREPISLDWPTIRRELTGRVVLVSGGGGSIGAELCRQLAGLGPAMLVILERSEFNLYQVERELWGRFPDLNLRIHLTDVSDAVAVNRWLGHYRPEMVFHAAAYKHVPLLEQQIREAIRNNVIGTANMARAAAEAGVSTFVLISSDKAVNPINYMGASKRLAEAFCQTQNGRSQTRFVIVRFGNVLDSAGSVVPLFREQIAAGGPVTVTDPEMERYFMTIPEASQLILQAAAVGKGGEIYVLDMGEPIKIRYLAEQMILLSGKLPYRDISIHFTGLRPGEKLQEELFHPGEHPVPTPYPKLLLAQHDPLEPRTVDRTLAHMRLACEAYDERAVRALLLEWFPGLEKKDPEIIETTVADATVVQEEK